MLVPFFWYDALCINEDDDEEKRQQVSFLQDIYRSRSRTIVQLGDWENIIMLFGGPSLIRDLVDQAGKSRACNAMEDERCQISHLPDSPPCFGQTLQSSLVRGIGGGFGSHPTQKGACCVRRAIS